MFNSENKKTKNQHYVPQSYLRLFSYDKINIGVYDFKNKIFIDKATIKGQAKEKWFYDKDNIIENSFSKVEDLFNQNRLSIIKDPYKSLTLYQKEVLYQDMFIQLVRTPDNANTFNNLFNSLAHTVWKNCDNSIVREHADDFKAEMPNAIIDAMAHKMQHPYILLDLQFKLLINKSDIPFITSDNPVSLYNQFLEKKHIPVCGLKNVGLQIFYTLTPNLAVVFYDGIVYKCGSIKKTFVNVERNDAMEINTVIALNSTNFLFYNSYLINQNTMKEIIRITEKYKVDSFLEFESGDDLVSCNILSYFRMQLSFMKTLDRARNVNPYDYRKNINMYSEYQDL